MAIFPIFFVDDIERIIEELVEKMDLLSWWSSNSRPSDRVIIHSLSKLTSESTTKLMRDCLFRNQERV
jgi:hypothetical protein